MSDSDQGKKEAGVPAWQLQSKDEPAKPAEEAKPDSDNRQIVIEQARKFLDEDQVRNASTDKKIEFLRSKGLRSEEIDELLGVPCNSEAVSASQEQPQEPSQSPQYTQPSPQTSYAPVTRDNPPIITYPEFLTKPQHPTPLITKQRLLTTLYLFSGLSALLYGTNNYLITPMLASLTTSRLSLAESASDNLSKLITKLEGMVSEIPKQNAHAGLGNGTSLADDESDEDPSEMFHRDIGVQTSLPTSPTPSRPGSPSPTSQTVTEDQTSRLQSLKSSMDGVIEDSSNEGHHLQELEATIGVLREYLDDLAPVTPSYTYGGGYSGAYGGKSEVDDEISKVKMSIRSVKGTLLSARSFPGGTRTGAQ